MKHLFVSPECLSHSLIAWFLKTAEFLVLDENQLSGDAPFEIFRLLKLKELRLSQNAGLGGTIPPEVESIHGLRILALDSNNMQGSYVQNE